MRLELRDPWVNIGNTPLVQLSQNLYAKLETVNPTGSIKDRPVKYIIERAIEDGQLSQDSVLVEATSGNTGISLSALGASLGLPVKIIMPENMSIERRQMMQFFGADIINVGHSDFSGAIDLRNQMVADLSTHWSPMQFENPLNIECHKNTTAVEILNQTGGGLAAFISGAGTGGTIMGVYAALREVSSSAKVVMVRPAEASHTHGIQGISDGEDFLADPHLFDDVISVRTGHAKEKVRDIARIHGLLVGISSAANLIVAEEYIKRYNPREAVVTILCDRGERYLSEFRV